MSESEPVSPPRTAPHERSLSRWGLRVGLLRSARATLTGALFGAAAALVGSGLLWATGVGHARAFTLAATGCAALVGLGVGVHRRWSRRELALFLDARLGSAEVITTSVCLPSSLGEDVRSALERRAADALARLTPRALALPVFSRWHALALPLLALALWVGGLPRPARATPPAKGSALLKRPNVPGLERIESLASAPALSPADAERMKKLAEEARRLRDELSRGISQREAQARAAALREGVAAEHQRFADQSERAGLEAAIAALEADPKTRTAAKALGEGDLVAFDERMQRLANQAESESREAALHALEEAARAAREKGAHKLDALLERQKKSFRERQAQAQALREFAQKLGSKLPAGALGDLSELDKTGDPKAMQRLSEALADALSKLSEAERQRLAERLSQSLQGGGPELAPLTREELERLNRALRDPRSQRELERALKELAKEDNLDAQRERSLDDAERGGAEAERGLGGAPTPLPLPIPGSGAEPKDGAQASNPNGNGAQGADGARGSAGSSRGGGRGEHAGATPKVDGDELRARASARWLGGAGLSTHSLGRAPGRAGETANQVGQGNLSGRASAEVGAVDGADIPEEYREHVGRYFEP